MISKFRLKGTVALLVVSSLIIPVSAHADWNQNNDEANRQRAMSSMRATSAANDRQNADAQFQSGLRNSASTSSAGGGSSGSSSNSGSSDPNYAPASSSGPQSVVATMTIRETGSQMAVRLTKDGEQGDIDAQYKLGVFYYAGVDGIRRDDSRARYWLKKAADQGHGVSAGQYGYMLEKGIGGPADSRTATTYFLRGAQKGDSYAKSWYALSVVLANDEANLPKAIAYAVEAADNGELIAQVLLGSAIYYNDGPNQNNAKSFKYLEQAVAQDSAMGMRFLGKWYVNGGDGVTRDIHKGVGLMERSAARGDTPAMIQLSRLYGFGFDGVVKSEAKAVTYLRQAVAKNDGEAMGILADFYYFGRFGIVENKPEALSLYKRGAELGDVESQSNYGGLLYEGILLPKDLQGSIAYTRKAAVSGNGLSQVRLGKFYYFGEGVTKDISEATRWFHKAAANKTPEALEIVKEPDIIAAAKALGI